MSVEQKPSSVPTDLPRPSYKWWVVGMLWFICFFNYADRMALNAVTSELKSHWNFDNEQVGLIISAFMWVYALSAPIAGWIGDKVQRKFLILAGLIVWSVVTARTALCRTVSQFVWVRAAEGLGETFYFPATMSLISDYHTKRTRSFAMGLHQTSVYAGTIGGTALAGLLAEKYGWEQPFVVFGICGVVLAIVLMLFLREPARNEAERLEAGTLNVAETQQNSPRDFSFESFVNEIIAVLKFLRDLAKTPSAMLLMFAFCGANSVGIVFISWMPLHLHENYEMSLAKAGFFATFYQQTGSMLGSIIGGGLADRLRRNRPGGRILTQALGVMFAIPFVYLIGFTPQVAPAIRGFLAHIPYGSPEIYASTTVQLATFLFILGVAKGIYDANIWASMYDVVPPARRAMTLGLANMLGWAGAGGLVYVVGLLTSGKDKMSMGQVLGSTAAIYAVVFVALLVAGLVFARKDILRATVDGTTP